MWIGVLTVSSIANTAWSKKIAKIKEGFLVDRLGGLEEISTIMQTWVQDPTSPSFTEEDNVHSVK